MCLSEREGKLKPHHHALECCREIIITFCCHHQWHCLPVRLWKHCTGHTGARPSMGEREVRAWATLTYKSQTHTARSVGIVQTPNVCLCVAWLHSPGYGGHAPSIFVDKVAAGVEDPAVVEGHEGVSGCGGRVLPILAVRILQRGELVLPQHLVHNKRPGGNTRRSTRHLPAKERVLVMNTFWFILILNVGF